MVRKESSRDNRNPDTVLRNYFEDRAASRRRPFPESLVLPLPETGNRGPNEARTGLTSWFRLPGCATAYAVFSAAVFFLLLSGRPGPLSESIETAASSGRVDRVVATGLEFLCDSFDVRNVNIHRNR